MYVQRKKLVHANLDPLLSCCELVSGHDSGQANLQISSLLLSCLHCLLQVSYLMLIGLLSLLLAHLHHVSRSVVITVTFTSTRVASSI